MWFEEGNISKRFDGIIKKAIEKSGLKPLLLKDVITGDSIPVDIMKGIVECRLAIFDISPMLVVSNMPIRNPNVMYELGLAHTWRNREEVIIVSDDLRDLPFDIQSLGVIEYNPKDAEGAVEKIKDAILFRLQEIEKIQRSVVRKAAESLSIQAHNLLMVSKGKIFHDATLREVDKILAIPVLLTLGLVEMLTDGNGYGYHPTQLGREVIKYYDKPLDDDDIKTYTSLYKDEY